MAIPASYTELKFAEFLHATLGQVAEALNWGVGAASYDEVVNESLLEYGVDDIATITGNPSLKKFRAIGKVKAWEAVVTQTAADFNFSADGGKYDRSQIHEMAMKNLALAQAAAADYLGEYRVGIDRIDHYHDPYTYRDENDRTLA